MAGEKIDIASAEASKSDRSYERSSIEFPYGDLNDAIEVVTAIHERAGTECEVELLAGVLNQSATSGAFRLKLQVARMAGFIEVERGSVSLTSRGRDAADPNTRPQALAEGFLRVPLYRQIYEKYKGRQLPPAAALEREMASLGVAKKQTAKARQSFERSAEQSGFYTKAEGRLLPPVARVPQPKPEQPPIQPGGGGTGGGAGELDPLILGLVRKLPAPDELWPIADRVRWLQAAANNFSLLYKSDDGGEVEVKLKANGGG
jgi:hypothetical protein